VRRPSLATEAFVAILLSAFLTTLIAGFFAHEILAAIIHAVVLTATGTSNGNEPAVLVRAEESILQTFDANAYVIIFVALIGAGLAAFLLSIRLSRPVRSLSSAVDSFTTGDHAQRMPVVGPREVASLARSFNRLADSLEEEDHLRRRMVADISHELRNPISVAMAQTELMLDGVLPADTDHLRALYLDMTHLEALVDDLREMALAESGRWHYDLERVDLSALLRHNAERAEQRMLPEVKIATDIPVEPVYVWGDSLRLEQVIRNILGNAKRHTRAGSITLRLTADEDSATVSIIDTGEGIAAEDLPHVFERFYRADTARSPDTGGAGLGLSIVRSVVRDHGGDVFARSQPGKETVVGFTIPRLWGERPANADALSSSSLD
jgi:two-component system, OmpR family, sensor histidine kinase BaeS